MIRFRTRRAIAVVGLLLVAALSCGKKDKSPVVPPTSATATLTGIALGSNGGGLPLAGVTITSSPSTGATATTNSFGYFSLAVPANTPVAIRANRVGFADHDIALQLATGENRAITFVLAALGGTTNLLVSAGGKVTDLSAKTAITLPPNFTSGTSNAIVSVTGIDPTTDEALALPGTLDAENSVGTLLSLEPAAVAEVRIGDGIDTDFALIAPAVLELHLPAAFLGDLRYAGGTTVPFFRYDAPTGRWKFGGNGQVVNSSVDGQPCVKFTITHLSWYAVGYLNGSNGCVSGKVLNGGVGAGGVTVEAFPGGIDVTEADGSYRVSAPPEATVQLLATRPGTGTVTLAATSTTAGGVGGACATQQLTLGVAAPPPTYTIAADLIRVFVAPLTRDEVGVTVIANTTPSPTPIDGAVVQIGDGATWKTVPFHGSGVYLASTGSPGAITLVPNTTYTLRVDLEPDGIFDATASVLMPAKPTITAPIPDQLVNPTFTAAWNDPSAGAGGYTARYIGSIESSSFGTVPVRFVVDAPGSSFDVGTGVGQPQFFMANPPLDASGSYILRLWATNGPVRYASGGGNVIFATPNIVPTAPGATNIFGWFSASARADSVVFGSLGSGTRPRLALGSARSR